MTTTALARPAGIARAAGLAYALPALGFGIPTPFVLSHLVRTGELPMTPFGFRSHSGPFEQLGQNGFVALGFVLLASCAVDVLAGAWLWRGRRRGAVLGLAATPIATLMAYGFAFPFLAAAIPVRLVLTVRAWPKLR
ncbi:MAG TPA: hypothetical protein VFV72_15855 [Candidatus Limnocylindrales bacterium]|nr:hypothetical protein [Candidatus Limnocylindrales bacterium]